MPATDFELTKGQRDAQHDTVCEAEDRYRKSQRKLEPANRQVGADFLHRNLRRLTIEIGKDQRNITSGKDRLSNYALPMLSLDEETLARLALRTITNRIVDSDKLPSFSELAAAIGTNCYCERKQRELSALCRGKSLKACGLPDVKKLLLKRYTSRHGPERVEEQICEFRNKDWSKNGGVELGGRILEITEAIGLIEIIKSRPKKDFATERLVQLSDNLDLYVDQLTEDAPADFLVEPLYRPMLFPPRPWTGIQGSGFLDTQNPELTNLVKKHRDNPASVAALKDAEQRGQLEHVYAAINALQETPWQLNRRIYAVMQYAWRNKIPLPGLPDRTKLKTLRDELTPLRTKRQQIKKREQELDTPERKGELDNEWAEYHKMVKQYHKPLHERQALPSKILRFKRILKTCQQLLQAGELVDELRFYFPFQIDYRGRAYSLVTSLSPQGDDHERALLEFADGKPLGKDGEFWLAVHVANTYGNDKVTFTERVAWVERHAEQISKLAAMVGPDGQPATDYIDSLPQSTLEFWKGADKRSCWSFLAACFEWWQNRNTSGFVSHLPIALDASASGYQHLSALSGDCETAKAVNLLPNLLPTERPQDFYQRVANELERSIKPMINQGNEWAIAWKDYITRKTVKLGVMTTPYGVTRDGLIKQLHDYIEELEEPNPWQDKDSWPDAIELSKQLKKCIEDVAKESVEVMKWLREVAMKLYNDFGLGLAWTTPADFPVVVEHYRSESERHYWINPRTGKKNQVVLRFPDPALGVDGSQQRSTIAPNFIHSLDAAHMMLTLHRLHNDGLRHFSVIHDSYAVHACDIPHMLRVLKEEFVSMYRKPLLEQFLDEQLHVVAKRGSNVSEATIEKLRKLLYEKCPRSNGLAIEEVLKSEYMFS